MERDVQEILIDRSTIANKVRRVAERIVADLQPDDPDRSGQLVLVPILTGSFIFVADLVRCLPVQLRIQMLWVTSYPGRSTRTQGPRLRNGLAELPDNLADTDVVVIDDILDSGSTLDMITGLLRDRSPRTLRTCVLLRKQRPSAMRIDVDYVCFDIPDRFVVGYGLDYDGYYRNLPDIVTLMPNVLEPAAGK